MPPWNATMPPNVPPELTGLCRTSPNVTELLTCGFHREKEKGRTFSELCGLICGARGRNRTGTPCGGGF